MLQLLEIVATLATSIGRIAPFSGANRAIQAGRPSLDSGGQLLHSNCLV